MKNMKPVDEPEDSDTDDMVDITDQVDLAAYVEENKEGSKDIILRIYIDGKYDGMGLNIGPLADTLIPKLEELGVQF